MDSKSVVIAVEVNSAIEVERTLEQKAGVVFKNGCARLGRCFQFFVTDVSSEVAYAADFLAGNALVDPNPIWNRLDSRRFKVEIRLSCDQQHIGCDSMEVFGEEVAICVSSELGVAVAYSIENGDVPFGIYCNGRKTEDFAEHYRRSLKGRAWLPWEETGT